ncbi:glycerol-3-phosphate ABC transporter, periplasmic glycerol-3-phosphate-binding protein [Geomicrobium sp. JCM 19037]|uniref:ABC transporter substrate-binding protein n=1 Tax=Geomicrobium sp. JCM 19037 TaxID=1460634 RepID=UPI00045F2BE8|nr:extracellular solute-binding protein [Geomicrobium sp. JCM 19037]GAK03863.1 glycerol-3-phosphate ABC transporter, periplasmic glycerol-3-phosphate-binding protein [Geomicrobium sp. JCM 19037]
MAKYILFFISVSIVLLLSLYLLSYSNHDNDLEDSSTNNDETLKLWTVEPALVEASETFSETNDKGVTIQTRLFTSHDQLLDELYGAVSLNETPDLAEIHAHYGVADFAEQGLIEPVETYVNSNKIDEMFKALSERFTFNDTRYALPIGLNVPVIYYNASLAEQYGMENINRLTWDSFLEDVDQLHSKVNNDQLWHFHTDMETPWYMEAMHNDLSFSPEQSELNQWSRLVNELGYMPKLTHQLAIPQFVDGDGLFLMSSLKQHQLLRRLIAGSFDLGMISLPEVGTSYPAGGAGIIVFSNAPKEKVTSFFQYLDEPEMSIKVSIESDYLPVRPDFFNDYQFEQWLRRNDTINIYTAINHLEYKNAQLEDEERWNLLQSLQESVESEGVD